MGKTPLARLAVVLATSAAALLVAPPSARASEPTASELQAARTLFAAAERDEDEGRWADALDKLHKVATVKMTAGVRFHIALCEENLGHLAVALAEYTAAESLAARDKNKEVQESLRAPLAALKTRVPELTINAPADVPNLEVALDGRVIASGVVGVPMPVDPGAHRIDARAAGRVPFASSVTLAERERAVVDVKLPEVAKAAAAAPPAPSLAIPAGSTAHAAPLDADDRAVRGRGKNRTAAIAVTAGAVALAGAGAAFLLAAGGAHDDAVAACAGQRGACGDDYKTSTRTLDALALGSWIGAGALSVVAVVLWVRPTRTPASAATTTPSLVVGPSSLGVTGVF